MISIAVYRLLVDCSLFGFILGAVMYVPVMMFFKEAVANKLCKIITLFLVIILAVTAFCMIFIGSPEYVFSKGNNQHHIVKP